MSSLHELPPPTAAAEEGQEAAAEEGQEDFDLCDCLDSPCTCFMNDDDEDEEIEDVDEQPDDDMVSILSVLARLFTHKGCVGAYHDTAPDVPCTFRI